jgi:hypothetical protein
MLPIPNHGDTLTLTDDWQVRVEWWERNLRMLAAFKLTGMVESTYYGRTTRHTVANKLFLGEDGKYTPVEITFPKGTTFTFGRYVLQQKKWVNWIEIKCSGSSKPKIKGLGLHLYLEDFSTMPAELTRAPEED